MHFKYWPRYISHVGRTRRLVMLTGGERRCFFEIPVTKINCLNSFTFQKFQRIKCYTDIHLPVSRVAEIIANGALARSNTLRSLWRSVNVRICSFRMADWATGSSSVESKANYYACDWYIVRTWVFMHKHIYRKLCYMCSGCIQRSRIRILRFLDLKNMTFYGFVWNDVSKSRKQLLIFPSIRHLKLKIWLNYDANIIT